MFGRNTVTTGMRTVCKSPREGMNPPLNAEEELESAGGCGIGKVWNRGRHTD